MLTDDDQTRLQLVKTKYNPAGDLNARIIPADPAPLKDAGGEILLDVELPLPIYPMTVSRLFGADEKKWMQHHPVNYRSLVMQSLKAAPINKLGSIPLCKLAAEVTVGLPADVDVHLMRLWEQVISGMNLDWRPLSMVQVSRKLSEDELAVHVVLRRAEGGAQ